MSDAYQATYDAVRSRIGSCNPAEIIREACNWDASWAIDRVRLAFEEAAAAQTLPSFLFRPSLSVDGNKWCALYGSDLQSGVAGFGDSPAAAMADFDRNWYAKIGAPPMTTTKTAAQAAEYVLVQRTLLAAALKRDGGEACGCMYHSRKAENEYETGKCPHQQLAAILAAPKQATGGELRELLAEMRRGWPKGSCCGQTCIEWAERLEAALSAPAGDKS